MPDTGTESPMVACSQSDSYTPSDLASLYRIPSDLEPTDTVGIVDVGSDPNGHGVTHLRPAHGTIYRLRFGGGRWQTSYSSPVRGR